MIATTAGVWLLLGSGLLFGIDNLFREIHRQAGCSFVYETNYHIMELAFVCLGLSVGATAVGVWPRRSKDASTETYVTEHVTPECELAAA